MNDAKFEKAYLAIVDCIDHVSDREETSTKEAGYAKELYDACKEFVGAYEYFGVEEKTSE